MPVSMQEILAAKLRQPSVMDQPSTPEWLPEYARQEVGLESVSPEDFMPSPKSLVAALKGAPLALGAIRSMAPAEFLRLAAPFGHQGGRQMDPKSVAYHLANPGVGTPYLSVKQTPEGLRVAAHDGRHRAVAAQQAGIPLNVDIRRSKRMERESPEITEEQLLSMIEQQGKLLPEY